MRWPDIGTVLGALSWAVCGAVATRLYMPERATADIDVLIYRRDSRAARRLLEGHRYVRTGDLAIGGSTWRSPDGALVDVIERDDPWVPAALQEAAANLDSQALPILPLPYLVVMKLQASRVQDLADLARMLGAAEREALDDVRRVARNYAPDDVGDLESLIELGKLEGGG